jgi:glycosyltransferase involved in cell wall biosynthesis
MKNLLPEIENGVPVERLNLRISKRQFAISLGRICPEKGFHIAVSAAGQAKIPILIAGEVFPYEEHLSYFRNVLQPLLGRSGKFIGAIDFERKRRLLTASRCLLVPSLVPETSSLVTMEALACGTPVVAFPNGALPELIENGKTGYLVENEFEMAEAIHRCQDIDPEDCRNAAREKFTSERMAKSYLDLYKRIIFGVDENGQGASLQEPLNPDQNPETSSG